MNDLLYIKHLFIRTPLERPAFLAKQFTGWIKLRKHPEHLELFLEGGRIDRALGRIVAKDSHCIDVGSHIGSMLSSLIRLAPDGKHLAFEPVPQKAAWLRKKFPEVEVKQMALGETKGSITFFQNLRQSGFSGQFKTNNPADSYSELTVECDRLDQVVPADRRITFIKVDVEGAEFLVLRGASDLIRRDRPTLLFESIPGLVDRLGNTRREFFDFLTRDHGYSIFAPKDFLDDGGPLDWDRFDQSHQYPFKALNYLAVSR